MADFSPSPFNWIDRLPDRDRATLVRELVTVAAISGDIYGPDNRARGIYRVEAGRAYMYLLSPEGRRVLLKRYEAGEVFGEVATLDMQRYPVFVSAGKRLRLSFIRFDRVEALRRASVEIDRAMVAAVCRMTRTLLTMLASATIDNANERVWARLTWLMENQPISENSKAIAITQLELADMLGLSRQTVNGSLQSLQAEGRIALMRENIVFL